MIVGKIKIIVGKITTVEEIKQRFIEYDLKLLNHKMTR